MKDRAPGCNEDVEQNIKIGVGCLASVRVDRGTKPKNAALCVDRSRTEKK